VVDLLDKVSSFDTALTPIYSPFFCKRYAQNHTPPRNATGNADSYAWLATSKFFGDIWPKLSPRGNTDDSSTAPDTGDDQSPSDVCAAAGQPEMKDCLDIKVSSGDQAIDFTSQACYQQNNRRWSDLYTTGNCQLTVGWDVTQGSPNIFPSDLTNIFNQGTSSGEGYVDYVDDNHPPVCEIGANICTVDWKGTLKRVGQDFP
jgi:hypothetical protein